MVVLGMRCNVKTSRPTSELTDNFAEISKLVHETSQPLFLTENGADDIVMMSTKVYENLLYEHEIYFKLKEAELEEETTDRRYYQ
jgi:PHD/YefM family antitoxin component YafN of YafNO toxin-antitoxin module